MVLEMLQGIVKLTSTNNSFQEKLLTVRPGMGVKIGRKVNAKTNPEPTNGHFDAKVLSRTHAEITFDKNTVWIQDLKSSNGTFVNGERLSEEGVLSTLRALKTGDSLDFGVDIKDDEGKKLYSKVSTLVTIDYESVPQTGESMMTGSRDAEELMALINDEKTLSQEASDALDRIRASFDFLEANTEHPTAPAQEIPSDFDAKFAEMNEKLSNLSKTVDLAKLDLRTIKSESTADNQTLISDNVSILESSVSEAMLKVANLEKTSERQLVKLEERMLDNLTMVESKLDARLHEIEGASTQLKETVLMDKNEYLGLSERMENLTVQLETEMKYSKSLSEELKALRKSLQNYESTLAQMKLKLNETPKEVVQVRPKSSKSTRVKSGTTSTVVLVFAIAICVGLGSAYLLSPDGMETFLQYLVFN